eukprot:TRINITY_DN2343_c0_g2_i6.p1 TRINITY_DN2343_c0_g2~~TRINITY_DN2343_c0_g2_i6.p1  ORF type:complete len:999 (-),score=37.81 TRINITY_DN2343_c0_g2_i6:34-3030(-)
MECGSTERTTIEPEKQFRGRTPSQERTKTEPEMECGSTERTTIEPEKQFRGRTPSQERTKTEPEMEYGSTERTTIEPEKQFRGRTPSQERTKTEPEMEYGSTERTTIEPEKQFRGRTPSQERTKTEPEIACGSNAASAGDSRKCTSTFHMGSPPLNFPETKPIQNELEGNDGSGSKLGGRHHIVDIPNDGGGGNLSFIRSPVLIQRSCLLSDRDFFPGGTKTSRLPERTETGGSFNTNFSGDPRNKGADLGGDQVRFPIVNDDQSGMVHGSSILRCVKTTTDRSGMERKTPGNILDRRKDRPVQTGKRWRSEAGSKNPHKPKEYHATSLPERDDMGGRDKIHVRSGTQEGGPAVILSFHPEGCPFSHGEEQLHDPTDKVHIATQIDRSSSPIPAQRGDVRSTRSGKPDEHPPFRLDTITTDRGDSRNAICPLFHSSLRNPLFTEFPLTLDSDPGGPDTLSTLLSYDQQLTLITEGRPLKSPSRWVAKGELDTLTSARLDLGALRSLDSSNILENILDVITNPQVFLRSFLTTARFTDSLRRGTSRHMLRFAETLETWGIITKSQSAEAVLPFFTIPKSNGFLRPVVDGRKINVLQERPPDMKLKPIQDLLSFILQKRWFLQHDGKSWFYQFPIHSDIRPFFALHLAGARGKFVRYNLNVLPMGWSFAPAIAHRASLVLTEGLEATAWVDNFLFASDTRQSLLKNNEAFLQRCQLVGAELKEAEDHGTPMQVFDALGIHFDLIPERQRYRMTEKWRKSFFEKVEWHLFQKGDVTIRCFYKIMGSVVWYCYVSGHRLCRFPCILDFLRQTAREVANLPTEVYDQHVALPTRVREEILKAAKTIEENPWIYRSIVLQEWHLWSDASQTRWAAILIINGAEYFGQGNFTEKCPGHIYFKELIAAYQVLVFALSSAPRHTKMSMYIDNLPVVKSIKKGHSSATVANHVLEALLAKSEIRDTVVNPIWVPSSEQRADVYTRTELIPRGGRFDPSCLHEWLTLWE